NVLAEGGLLEALLDDRLQVLAHVLACSVADQALLLGQQLVHQVVVVALEKVGGAALFGGVALGGGAGVAHCGCEIRHGARAVAVECVYFCAEAGYPTRPQRMEPHQVQDNLRTLDPLNAEWVTIVLLLVLAALAFTNMSSPRKWRLLA